MKGSRIPRGKAIKEFVPSGRKSSKGGENMPKGC
jgi:hypothetical protein